MSDLDPSILTAQSLQIGELVGLSHCRGYGIIERRIHRGTQYSGTCLDDQGIGDGRLERHEFNLLMADVHRYYMETQYPPSYRYSQRRTSLIIVVNHSRLYLQLNPFPTTLHPPLGRAR